MEKKMTITEQIDLIEVNGIDGLTPENFAFLVDRARKSIRTRSTKPTKEQVERADMLAAVTAYVKEQGTVTCADIEEHFGVTNQKAARLLLDADGVVKAAPAKGKVKATWTFVE